MLAKCWQRLENSCIINHLNRECKVTLKLYALIGFAVSLISTAAKKHSVHVSLSYLMEHHFDDKVLLLYGEIQGNVLLNNLKGKMSNEICFYSYRHVLCPQKMAK